MKYIQLLILVPLWTIIDAATKENDAILKDLEDKISTLLYAGAHDIIKLGIPINLDHILSTENKGDLEKIIFFIEAEDTTSTETDKKDTSLYVLKNGIRTKLLDNARDISIVNASKPVYIAAKDGIYLYNETENAVKKFGSVDDEIISIAAEKDTGVIYILNKQKQVYKVKEEGKTFSIINNIKNATDITVDSTGHVYYLTEDKSIYVFNTADSNITKVKGIPNTTNTLQLIKNWFQSYENHAFFRLDDKFYAIDGLNATAISSYSNNVTTGATVISGDIFAMVYFVRDKKIYEFNVIAFIAKRIAEQLFEKFLS